MKDYQVTVIVPIHAENQKLPTMALRSIRKQIEAPETEIIIVADRPTDEVREYAPRLADAFDARLMFVDNGDLGLTRNDATQEASAPHVAYLDADDIYGCRWLRQAFEHSKKFKDDKWLLHPSWMVLYGAQTFLHRCFGMHDPEYDIKSLIQYNPVSALSYSPKSLLLRYPQEKAEKGFGFDDWTSLSLMIGEGVLHECVHEGVHLIRLKHDQNSLAFRTTQKRSTLKRRAIFDIRNLPNAERFAPPQQQMPEEVFRQVLFAHHEVGEKQLILSGQEECRVYPRQKIWDDQAWLRDQIGTTKNVVLVNELLRGGAEKYALEYAKALGPDVVIIETEPGPSPWAEHAAKYARVIRWHKKNLLALPEQGLAIQRALIQCELDTCAIFNSKVGWALVHENSQVLAKKVIAASFATIPLPLGFTSCPAFFLNGEHPTLTLLTDNERHAAKLRDYCNIDPARIVVIPPRVEYEGGSKRSHLTKKHLRVLWAGRGSDEKCPQALPLIAQLLREEIDLHVYGDVPQMPHALDNLKYRGPFDGFASIDGTFDVYLMTSVNEGMPNTALEAALADLPIVASDVGDLKKISCVTYQANLSPERMAHNAAAALKGFLEHGSDFDVAKPRTLVKMFSDVFGASVRNMVAM